MDLYDALALTSIPAVIAVIYGVWRLIPAMRGKVSRGGAILLTTVAIVLVGWFSYFAHYGECTYHSKFCVISIAGTRSEIGCQWETWSCYVSTYPANEPI